MKKVLYSFIVFFVFIGGFSAANAHAASTKTTTLKLANGAVYTGEVKNGKPNGKGTMKYNKNKTYQGSWVNGKRSGYGKYVHKTYIDNKQDAEEHGAYIKEISKTIYQGYWKDDKYYGSGQYTTSYVYKEFSDMINESFRDFTYTVQKGEFKNNTLIKGYTGAYGKSMSSLSYKDSGVTISLNSDKDNFFPDLNSSFDKAFPYFSYEIVLGYSKKSSKTSEYSLTLSENGISKGTYINGDIVNGMLITRDYNSSFEKKFNREDYKNKLVYQGSVMSYDEFQKVLHSEGKNFMSFIKPYVKGFTEVQNKLRKLSMEG